MGKVIKEKQLYKQIQREHERKGPREKGGRKANFEWKRKHYLSLI